MRLQLPAALGLAVLAGCDGGNDTAATSPIRVTGTVDYQMRMRELNDLDRGLALRRAVQDAGNPCRRPEADALQGQYKALDMWLLRCSDSGDWTVFLAGAGDVQVRSCEDVATLGLPTCKVARLEAAPEGS